MSDSIKKRHASNIYFGIQKNTGQLMHISEVHSGVKCSCNCAACGQPLEARKGDLRKHHFAHISNYECMYSSEVSIYKALAVLMEQHKKIVIPPVTLSFPAWSAKDQVQPEKMIEIDSVEFKCEKLAYPPDFFLSVQGHRLRIIIDFAHYYDEYDKLLVLQSEANNLGYSCLMYHVPGVDKDDAFVSERMAQLLLKSDKAEWIFNRVAEKWRQRFISVAEQPLEHEDGYECFLHEGYYKGKFSARWVDCAYCRFNVDQAGGCLCTAKAGIRCVADFSASPEKLKEKTDIIRKKNDNRIKNELQAAQQKRDYRLLQRQIQEHYPPAHYSALPAPSDAALLEEQKRISDKFELQSTEWTVDCFGRRWIRCKLCGQIQRDTAMAYYGGQDGPNQGVCSNCSRQQR